MHKMKNTLRICSHNVAQLPQQRGVTLRQTKKNSWSCANFFSLDGQAGLSFSFISVFRCGTIIKSSFDRPTGTRIAQVHVKHARF